MQSWLGDSEFWTDVATYVSDWSQEVYGDIRAHAVPGEPTSVRREYLNDYLQHPLVLASAGPPEIEAARSFLGAAYSPLANAAWPRETAWGWTMVPADQMAAYISAQVDALRSFSVASGQPQDHWGFAWAPRNTTGVPDAEFAAQTGQLLDRLAAAIRDSAVRHRPRDSRPPVRVVPARRCARSISRTRRTTRPGGTSAPGPSRRSTIGRVPATLVAGVPSPLLQLSLQAAGTRPVVVTLRSTSAAGAFSTSPAGPWSPTLALSLSPGVVLTFCLPRHACRAGDALGLGAGHDTGVTGRDDRRAGPTARVSVTPASALRSAREARPRWGPRRPTRSGTWHRPASPGASRRPRPGSSSVGGPTRVDVPGGTAARDRDRDRHRQGSGRSPALRRSSSARQRSASGRSCSAAPHAASRRQSAAIDGARRPVSQTALTLVVRAGRSPRRARAGTSRVLPARAACSRRRPQAATRSSVTRAVAQGFSWNGKTPRNRFCRT